VRPHPEATLEGLGVGCDVIVFTESETRALRARGDAFSHAVFDEGVRLAARPDLP
jgi:hypothetical protein